ncbi:MAG: phosphate acetyltransferase [Flaviflexus sp.]|nr:phosphate acetyltransferase [Flaviflexus sp.]
MTDSLYLASTEAVVGVIDVARSIIPILKERYEEVGVFRPYVNGDPAKDVILSEFNGQHGTSREHYIEDEPSAMDAVIRAYRQYAVGKDAVLIIGHVDGDPVNPGLIARSGRTAANLGATMGLIVEGGGRSAERVAGYAELAAQELEASLAPVSITYVLNAPEGTTEAIGAEHPGMRVAVDAASPAVLDAIADSPGVTTPLMFETELTERARADKKRIVLPEPDDDRILQAAATILEADFADLILVGDAESISARAGELGLDVSRADVVDPTDASYLDRYAPELARLRAKKGMTEEQARAKLADVSYFATMMVHMGDADGMVSGATHTTAETILPSFQIIKTKPETSIVSSVFLMLMPGQVLVYGDCAVNPNPTPAQLADIAISSAETAAQFGVEPRVGMLSYSTGSSGTGADVEAVIEATRLAKEKRPDLAIEGPLQYDAAVDPVVAKKKLPDSPIAGRVNVFIFPSLNAGNIGYKAVQRSSGAVAVGPVLQGLNRPVNDLSRGALVDDIINTVAITAVQAQG